MLSLGCAKTLEGNIYTTAAYDNSMVFLQVWDITTVKQSRMVMRMNKVKEAIAAACFDKEKDNTGILFYNLMR